jgi:hypothetical protein
VKFGLPALASDDLFDVGLADPKRRSKDLDRRSHVGASSDFINVPLCQSRLSRVATLLFACSPLAITRLVIAVVVDPLDRCPRRAFAHVGKKVLEQTPPRTHGDASPAIILPCGSAWIRATRDHRLPRTIGWGARHSVRPIRPCELLRTKTTAAASVPAAKIVCCDFGSLPAVAVTFPTQRQVTGGTFVVSRSRDDNEPTETHADQVGTVRRPLAIRTRYTFAHQTSARSCAIGSRQAVSANRFDGTAVALTLPALVPECLGRFQRYRRHHHKTTKPFAEKIEHVHIVAKHNLAEGSK